MPIFKSPATPFASSNLTRVYNLQMTYQMNLFLTGCQAALRFFVSTKLSETSNSSTSNTVFIRIEADLLLFQIQISLGFY